MKHLLNLPQKWFFKFLLMAVSSLVEFTWWAVASYIVVLVREWWVLSEIFTVLVATIGVLLATTLGAKVLFYFCSNEIGYFSPNFFWRRTIVRTLLSAYFIYCCGFEIGSIPMVLQTLFYVLPYIVKSIILLQENKFRVSERAFQKREVLLGCIALCLWFVACLLLAFPHIGILPLNIWRITCFMSAILVFLSTLLLFGIYNDNAAENAKKVWANNRSANQSSS